MFDPTGTKETLCTHCAHCAVCIYKNDYLDILKAISNAVVSKESTDGKFTTKRVIHYDFIGDISLPCKYYQTRLNQPICRDLAETNRI